MAGDFVRRFANDRLVPELQTFDLDDLGAAPAPSARRRRRVIAR
jgi:hypothetical protein